MQAANSQAPSTEAILGSRSKHSSSLSGTVALLGNKSSSFPFRGQGLDPPRFQPMRQWDQICRQIGSDVPLLLEWGFLSAETLDLSPPAQPSLLLSLLFIAWLASSHCANIVKVVPQRITNPPCEKGHSRIPSPRGTGILTGGRESQVSC